MVALDVNTGTCSPWAAPADVCAPCSDEGFDVGVLTTSLQVASDILFDLTRRRWPGVCTDVVRPCGYRTRSRWGVGGVGWCGCNSSSTCGCRRLSEIRLPGHPVVEVTSVKIDGVVVAPARYRIDNNRWLVYLPESDEAERRGWPCCQRLDLADTEDDTWSIAYSFGTLPPPGGNRAAASLGCQLALACSPATVGQCALPKRVTSIVRQGVTMAVVDPLTLFKDGLTGLADVDLWVAAVNRGAATRPATVWSPNGHGATIHRHVGT